MDSEKRDKMTVDTASDLADDSKVSVPYIAFESVQARNERHIKRLIIVIIILISLLFASNMAWLCFMYGVDFESYEYEQGDGGINIIGNENEDIMNYGTENQSEEADPQNGS